LAGSRVRRDSTLALTRFKARGTMRRKPTPLSRARDLLSRPVLTMNLTKRAEVTSLIQVFQISLHPPRNNRDQTSWRPRRTPAVPERSGRSEPLPDASLPIGAPVFPFWWPREEVDQFPDLGPGGRCQIGLAVFRRGRRMQRTVMRTMLLKTLLCILRSRHIYPNR
jgi:hypothetical protein